MEALILFLQKNVVNIVYNLKENKFNLSDVFYRDH